jgi:hypothetical protein
LKQQLSELSGAPGSSDGAIPDFGIQLAQAKQEVDVSEKLWE